MYKIRALAVLLGICVVSACQTTPQVATLPATTQISQPDDSVPPEHAAFSGIWSGEWDGVLSSKLAVEKVSADGSVSAVYAWGDYPGRFSAGRVRRTGQIENNVLTLERFGNGAIATFEMRDDGTLAATYDRQGSISEAVFTKESGS